ncbi:aldose epimerase family protein [Sinorhizobium medicae]|uniref:Aldose 1-epimerase n=1 Tax=Sinorhizobium medicae TaxID=110321 RepID=A0A508WXT9_9HYPH|nr:aldose epimerase family protein [Sinorhizobium medicae]MDX0423090.1 galactose-1-epimerase [Sinorhizobium medicae]MDX0521136.1 galactose-1-epimerase [Sinorhizobium medicae]MDX0545450.1 galactose-1-epimerase [Sinorhizobium medicae]MDX0632842.1 galactose-1-epimerase [Sinorhizobium medicae]MDX0713182.1 galactose-1-epimerase [Sinorhizobium medicae]
MTTDMEIFGHLASGEPVHRVTLKGGGLTASVITWGSVIQDLRLDGHAPPLVLGFEDFPSYPAHSSYFGATPGRNANRIGDGRFSLDGRAYQLERNEKGVTHLHGGSDNIARRNWTIVGRDEDSVTLKITDPDGRAGYPGNCTITCTYRLKPGGTLNVVYETETDAPTLANVCQHSYFNLDGGSDAFGHDIMIAADHFLPTDERQIPTGEIRPVDGTAFDLREMTSLKRQLDGDRIGYDHNFCLSPERMQKRSVALVRSINSGVSLEVLTTESGVQLYTGEKLDVAVPGLEGRRYGAFAGFCLETQIWPDAVNHEGFPKAILRPGETLRQETDYVFTRN